MLRWPMLLVLSLAVLSGCTEEAVGPSPMPALPTSPAPSTPSATATTVEVEAPGPAKGEVTRAVLSGAEGAGSQQRTVAATPVNGRSYVVKSACAADQPTTTVTYRLLDARALDNSGQPTDERVVMAATIVCDGVPRMDSAGPLSFPVLVQYDVVPAGVNSAYAVVVPE